MPSVDRCARRSPRRESSIAAMARSIGIARSALDNYVTGKRAIPVPVVYAVCADVGIEPHLLLARAEERLRQTARPLRVSLRSVAHPMSPVRAKIAERSLSNLASDTTPTPTTSTNSPQPQARHDAIRTRRNRMQHLLRLAEEQGLRVIERPGRTRGGYDPAARLIRLTPGMSARTARSVLAHELGHALLGHAVAPTLAIRAQQERQADEWARLQLITPRAYAEAEEVRGPHLASLAFELEVTIELVTAYQRLLRESLLVTG